VRRLASDLLERRPHIDVLASNVGGLWTHRTITADGYEQTFQINTLAPYSLTRLLTERLRESGGRVVFTISGNHKNGEFNLDDLDSRTVTSPPRLPPTASSLSRCWTASSPGATRSSVSPISTQAWSRPSSLAT
jgi:NAD(P)-dependent dehydrogenase (short-subunit alcohol dehydrogenase family)